MGRKMVSTADGRRVFLYQGKDCWFLYQEEAQYSLDGHTGPEALDLILGIEGAIYKVGVRRLDLTKKPFMNREVRRWIAETCQEGARV